jgi:hypothetical protein
VCESVCLCVYVCVRERERVYVSVCVYACLHPEIIRITAYVGNGSFIYCFRMCVCGNVFIHVCVCARVKEMSAS